MKQIIANHKNFLVIYLLGFIWALAMALPTYIQSSFLEEIVGVDKVGLYFTIATALAMVVMLGYYQLIKRFSNLMVTICVLLITGLSMIALRQQIGALIVGLFFTLQYIGFNLLIINLDIFLENITTNSQTGKIRATFLTIINTAWAVSPILMGQIAERFDFGTFYLIAGCLLLPTILILLFQKKQLSLRVSYQDRNPIDTFFSVIKNKDLRNVFCLRLGLNYFYAIMVLYAPIYLHQQIGFSWTELGFLFTIMLLPFIIFQLPAGTLADRFFGEKEISILGIGIMIIAILFFFLVRTDSFLAWAIILFGSRVGAALLEVMTETYFFKKVNVKDIGIINGFRVIGPAGYLIATFIAFVFLRFVPLEHIFLFLLAGLMCMLIPAIAIKDTK